MVETPSVPDSQIDTFLNDNFNHPLWILDFIPSPACLVVPQKMWTPPNQSDWRRYVEQAVLRMPVFFVQHNGAIGLPLTRAVIGDTAALSCAERAAPVGNGHSTQIRIAWPGYESWERQIQIRDQTRDRNMITLERFAKLVASVVDRFLTHAANAHTYNPNWRVGPGGITRNDVVLVGTVQVSAGGWMPILQVSSLSPGPAAPVHSFIPVHA
ncbi:hypothetical protein F5148DRAFT_983583 [Russula earlei]|uniref:Uncharacterized protein n=1 Tax=Russula earlei TaxID=71964 RepID=A0ACC0U2A5_9AGAM|nr:hypothetical protein F5148DRAFT_983583 [Russula earlei]